jgi:phage tail sheath protein FI
MRPGVNVEIREVPPARQAPTDTGVWFVAGLADKGPTDKALLITSLSEYTRYYGPYVSYGFLYDALDVFFREGGGSAYVTRVVGPAATAATITLNDGSAAPTLKVDANSPGEWGNALNVQVIAGAVAGEFILIITHDVDGEVERTPSLVDKAAAIAWATGSKYIKLTDLASVNDPAVVAATGLAGGLDDRASITDAHWTTSLTRFTKDLGPGQVSFPGRTTAPAHASLIAHVAANNRVAILDAPNTNSAATLLSLTQALYGTNSKWAAIYGPWVTVPGVVSSTLRTIPPSPLVAGAIARTDALTGSSNTPAAGENGQALFATGLSVPQLADVDREDLNDAGFNALITKYGGVRIYGWRSLANPATQDLWINFGNSRQVMQITAEADEIGESYLFDEIDGQGQLIAAFGGSLTGMLLPYYEAGSLYGTSPNEAFRVDVGPSVNTPTTIANRELRAAISVRISPFAEMIVIQLVKQQITQPL